MNLQQENYLSSVAKSQRILLSSDLISGLNLVKVEVKGATQLIQIGGTTEETSWNCPESKIDIQTIGFFSYRFLHCFENNKQMRISFYSANSVFRWVFLSAILIITLLLAALVYILLVLHKREVILLETISNISRQVAHDIRSPLSALRIAAGKLKSSSAEASIINDASESIDKIASELLQKSKSVLKGDRSDFNDKDLVSIRAIIEQIKQEKSLQYPDKINVDISKGSDLIRIRANKTKTYRALSNLVNNALEAIDEKQDGVITLGLRHGLNQAQVVIIDNGKGIPKDVLFKIGKQEFTFEKENGNGLGFFYAKSFIESVGGKISISSMVGEGTIVTVTFKSISLS